MAKKYQSQPQSRRCAECSAAFLEKPEACVRCDLYHLCYHCAAGHKELHEVEDLKTILREYAQEDEGD